MDGTITMLGLDTGNVLRPIQVDTSGRIIVSATGGGVSMSMIEDKLLVSQAADVVFADIPDIFKSLQVIYVGRTTVDSDEDYIEARFNDDSGYRYYSLIADVVHDSTFTTRESSGANKALVGILTGNAGSAGYASSGHFMIPGYTSAAFYKQLFGQNSRIYSGSSGYFQIDHVCSVWRSLDPITKISLFLDGSAYFLAGSRFTLYGIN